MKTITPSHGELQKYRIYFEPVELKKSLELLQTHFSAATIFHGEGLWIGEYEKTTVFEIFSTVEEGVIEALSEELRALNSQNTVTFTVEPVKVRNISCKEQKRACAPDVSYPLV